MIHSQRLSRSRGKDRGVGGPSTFRRPTRKETPVVGNKTDKALANAARRSLEPGQTSPKESDQYYGTAVLPSDRHGADMSSS